MADAEWDVFISHASEDKSSVAGPLAEDLLRARLRVWIDAHELKLGDSLTAKINEGLARSRYGVVILSPHFLAKGWPRLELGALLAIEMRHGKRVLPVLHNIQFESLLREFPLMADKLCTSTEAGLHIVATEICRAVGLVGDFDTVSPSPLSPEVGTSIGSYKIEAQLGVGGSGVVYRVRSSAYPYPLALKLFHPLRSPYAHLFPLFSRGYRAVAAVRHPNVIAVHDHGAFEFGGAKRAYITMDFIEGTSLDVWCGRSDSPKERYRSALPVFRQIAAALCAAHETTYLDDLGFEVATVLHGDVKPANVLVSKKGSSRVIDFLQLDVQRLIDPRVVLPEVLEPRPITAAMGTPGYMAPEQQDRGVVTIATDIYGLGVTFAHALADKDTSNPILDVCESRDFPPNFRNLVGKMVAWKPEDRPARMRDVLHALGDGRNGGNLR